MEKDELKGACECCLSVKNLRQVSEKPLNLIALCFSIQITNKLTTEKFPTFICNLCDEKIKDCYQFRCQILDSQMKLKRDYNLLNSNSFKYESEDQYFQCEEFIKKELLSDVDNTIDSNNSIAKNQSNNKDNCRKPKKEIENNIKQEFKNSKLKKKMIGEKSKLVKKNYKHNVTSLPFKLDKEAVICEMCGEKFTGHRLLISHMAVHYPNFVCDICGKPFVLKGHLQSHMKFHKGENASCTECKKVVRASNLRAHMAIHSDNKRHACPHCAERFTSYDYRAKHMEKVHNVDIYKYHCKMCSKKFHLCHILTSHIRRFHFKELNVSCNLCGKGFYDNHELKRHMVKHTGEKKYKCDICSKNYTKKFSLVLHMRIHTGNVIKYKCSHCGKEFTQRGSLKVHIKNIHEK